MAASGGAGSSMGSFLKGLAAVTTAVAGLLSVLFAAGYLGEREPDPVPPTVPPQAPTVPPTDVPLPTPPTDIPPEPPVEGPVPAFGQIQNIWVEHNVTANNELGMHIHVTFTIDNRLNTTSNLSAYFAFTDGTILQDFNGTYTSTDGQVSVGLDFTPAYASTIYDDFVLFMPYSELHMAPGSYDLMLYVSLFDYAFSEHIARSVNVFFQYTQN